MEDGGWSLPESIEQDEPEQQQADEPGPREPGQRRSTVRRRRALLATAVIAAAIVGALVATGAFSGGSEDRKPQAAAKTPAAAGSTTAQPAAAPLLGTWRGTATQTATTREKFPAKVRLTITGSALGKPAGTLSEKARGLRCDGRIKLVSADATQVFRYDENANTPTGCVDSTTVTVKSLAGGDIDFYEIYTADDGNQGTVVGKLKRSGAAP